MMSPNPSAVRELVARVRAVLRRPPGTAGVPAAVLCAGSLEVDPLAVEARYGGVALDLTRLEFELLATLARHPGQVLSRQQLLDQAWGFDYYGDTRAVDSAVKRLRAKLLAAGADPELIATVRGIGYKLERE